jgi:hypothetical protein
MMKKVFLMLLVFPFLAAALPLQRDILPSIQGWQLHKDDAVYTQDNLFDLIDGAAEVYLSYGFMDLHTAEYRADGVQPVRVEMYKHSSPLNAFGVYSAERQPTYAFIDVGTQGYIEDNVLNFFTGVYYIKLTTDEPKESGRRGMLQVAHAIAEYLRQPKEFPAVLALFPSERKTANAETYISENYLGYKCLHTVYTALYEDTSKIQLFIIPGDKPADASAMLAAALIELGVETSDHPKDGAYDAVDKHNGPIHFLLKGSMLCGVMHCTDAEKASGYLKQLGKRLP